MQAMQIGIWNQIGDSPATPPQSFQATGSYDRPGHIAIRPGLLTSTGQVRDVTTAQRLIWFTFGGQDGDVMEVTLQYTLNQCAQVAPKILTGSGLTGGVFENAHLDNTNTSGLAGARTLDNVGGWAIATFLG